MAEALSDRVPDRVRENLWSPVRSFLAREYRVQALSLFLCHLIEVDSNDNFVFVELDIRLVEKIVQAGVLFDVFSKKLSRQDRRQTMLCGFRDHSDDVMVKIRAEDGSGQNAIVPALHHSVAQSLIVAEVPLPSGMNGYVGRFGAIAFRHLFTASENV
jgi:hypothetical protein